MSVDSVQAAPHTTAAAGVAEARPSLDVAIVIPAFNEEDGVGLTIDGVRDALEDGPYSFEIIVVDDGSTDRTADRAAQHGARVIKLPRNGGYGAALKTGIRDSVSEHVVIIDADGTYPVDAVPGLLNLAADADMVVGARSARDPSIPLERRPAKWVLGKLASYLAGTPIPDLNSGLRVLRRSALVQFMHLLPQGFSFTMTITLSMLCTHHRVIYEPVVCAVRIGSSKIRPTDAMTFLLLIIRTVVLFNPLKVFLPFGAALFTAGAIKLGYDIYIWNLSESAVIALLGAAIVWSVGLLADSIARLQLSRPDVR